MKPFIYLKNVVTLELDKKKCVGCGICMIVCPHAVFGMNQKRVRIENRDACMECGACAKNCPAGAIFVKSGVGCATAVINSMLGRKSDACCCVIEEDNPCESAERTQKISCC